MTITLAWVRNNKDTTELLVASDSRLRSRGAIDQAQKIFRLDRGDCCLGFCGDAQVAYPLFVQVGSALNNYIRTRTRAADVTNVVDNVRWVLNNLIASWDISPKEKDEELAATKIMFAGWSWKFKRFDIGFFKYRNRSFEFHHQKARLGHPWNESQRSLVFIGDYEAEFRAALAEVLERRHGKQPKTIRKAVNFDYEPIEALAQMLRRNKKDNTFPLIGGAPQLLKIYVHGNDMPIVIRQGTNEHFLLGRRLSEWEKTGYPILDLRDDTPHFLYPMAAIPVPQFLHETVEVINDGIVDTGIQSDL
ncbi:hypothetical protein [uncultured Bradyrhizobium sp.]|uniref:hypothetical protein n=1 Tax=uncultured Bradyrhizobium sp. TaxID=199684 RepID=UPI002606E8DD|nr:hypothetical protein [uncultured Bradyrhizobium sp.]